MFHKHPTSALSKALCIAALLLLHCDAYAGCIDAILAPFRSNKIEVGQFTYTEPKWKANTTHRVTVSTATQSFSRTVNVSFTPSAQKSLDPIFVYATDGQLHETLFELIPNNWPVVLISVETSADRSDEYLGNSDAPNFDTHDSLFRSVVPHIATSIFSRVPNPSRTVLFGVSNGAAYVHGLLFREQSLAKNLLALSMTRLRKAIPLPSNLDGVSIYAVAGGLTPLERLARNFTSESMQKDKTSGAKTYFQEYPQYGHDYEMWLTAFIDGMNWLFELPT